MSNRPDRVLLTAVFLGGCLLTAGCSHAPRRFVRLGVGGEPIPAPVTRAREVFRLGVAPVVSPKQSAREYEAMAEFLGRKLEARGELTLASTYEDMSVSLQHGGCEAAFVCSYPFVKGQQAGTLRPLVSPQVHGETTYRSVLIVRTDSPYHDLGDLQGKTFAFTDPQSCSGRLVPTYWLATELGETPERFFESYYYTYGHDNAITAVTSKTIEAAAVDSLVYDYMTLRDSDLRDKLRVIRRSEPLGAPPVVTPADLDSDRYQQLQRIFLTMHQEKDGREILARLGIDRFVRVPGKSYQRIADMAAKVGWP